MKRSSRRGCWIGAVLSLLLLVSGCGESQDSVTLYGDGSIACPDLYAGADADDDPIVVGTVDFEPGPGEIEVTIVLTDAAPDSVYYVEVWSDESCETETPLGGYSTNAAMFTTDGAGAGEVAFAAELEAGTYRLNVDVVNTSDDLADPRHGEIAAEVFTEVVVPAAST